jgi:hypothetical protein
VDCHGGTAAGVSVGVATKVWLQRGGMHYWSTSPSSARPQDAKVITTHIVGGYCYKECGEGVLGPPWDPQTGVIVAPVALLRIKAQFELVWLYGGSFRQLETAS